MAQMRQFCCDDETGEVLTYGINDETGEPCLDNEIPILHYFENRILETVATRMETPKYNRFPKGYMCKTKKFQSLKANIIAGSNTISHRMLLLPTLMFCPALLCAILSLLEVFLHIRCHKKNKCLKDPNLYYMSPFHMITSMFCGVCRDIESASKIGQLQDKRRNKYDYFRGIAI